MVYKKNFHHKKPAASVNPRPAFGSKSFGSSKKGVLNFLFSFNGAISRELFTGSMLSIAALSVALGLVYGLFPEYEPTYYAFGIAQTLLLASLASIGYKRAHALGISGFYSIVGTMLFMPFFKFLKPARDMADDGSYSRQFAFFKRLGGALVRTSARQFLYMTGLFGVVVLGCMAGNGWVFDDMAKLFSAIYAFNLVQLVVMNTEIAKRYYSQAVKILSFLAYNECVIAMTKVYVAESITKEVIRVIFQSMTQEPAL
ncbi:MAG: hypothetical protein LBO78_03300 [Rickettsiales bacterium]|jgi:uncharacterized membrane protein YhaH (DUF805 family)|nr:hypothetical protein [Rickettsiales bacterium]